MTARGNAPGDRAPGISSALQGRREILRPFRPPQSRDSGTQGVAPRLACTGAFSAGKRRLIWFHASWKRMLSGTAGSTPRNVVARNFVGLSLGAFISQGLLLFAKRNSRFIGEKYSPGQTANFLCRGREWLTMREPEAKPSLRE